MDPQRPLPSLPNMTRYFGTDYSVMQLSVSLYLGVNALLQLVIGPLSDRFGRRPVMLGGLALFILATVGTLLATTALRFVKRLLANLTLDTARL